MRRSSPRTSIGSRTARPIRFGAERSDLGSAERHIDASENTWARTKREVVSRAGEETARRFDAVLSQLRGVRDAGHLGRVAMAELDELAAMRRATVRRINAKLEGRFNR
jgi:hypothetical protein